MLIGDFDAHGGFARNGSEDAYGLGAHAERDIFIEARNFLDADAGSGDDLVARNDRADVNLTQGDIDAEFAKNTEEIFGVGAVFFLAVAGGGFGLLFEQGKRGEFVGFVVALRERDFGRFLGLLRFDNVELKFAGGSDGEIFYIGRGACGGRAGFGGSFRGGGGGGGGGGGLHRRRFKCGYGLGGLDA